MRELIAESLWIGNALDVRSEHLTLNKQGVSAVVDLAYEESPAVLPREIIYLRVPLKDDSSNSLTTIRLAVETTALLLREKTSVLVGCSAGLSRSPTVATITTAITRQQEPIETLTYLMNGKPCDISPGFWKNAVENCRDLLPKTRSA